MADSALTPCPTSNGPGAGSTAKAAGEGLHRDAKFANPMRPRRGGRTPSHGAGFGRLRRPRPSQAPARKASHTHPRLSAGSIARGALPVGGRGTRRANAESLEPAPPKRVRRRHNGGGNRRIQLPQVSVDLPRFALRALRPHSGLKQPRFNRVLVPPTATACWRPEERLPAHRIARSFAPLFQGVSQGSSRG